MTKGASLLKIKLTINIIKLINLLVILHAATYMLIFEEHYIYTSVMKHIKEEH